MTTQSNGSSLMVQGRIVWTVGSLFKGRQKVDFHTKQPKIGRDGNPVIEFGFGLAIPKVDPTTGQNTKEFVKIWQILHQEAYTIFPSGQLPPDFAMKYKLDTDIDKNGKPYSDREGYPGHIVVACTTHLAIKYFKFEGGNNIIIPDGIKNGDYVNVQLNIKAHPAEGQGKAGLYVNPSAVQLIQPGKEIINTPSGDQIFGQNIPGYSGQVVADTAPQMPNMQPQAPGQPVMPPVQPGVVPQAPVPAQPHYGVLPQNMQPQAPGQPVMPPVQPCVVPQAPMPGGQPLVPPMGNVPVAPLAAPVLTPPLQTPVMPTPAGNGYALPASHSNIPQAVPGQPVMPPMPQ